MKALFNLNLRLILIFKRTFSYGQYTFQYTKTYLYQKLTPHEVLNLFAYMLFIIQCTIHIKQCFMFIFIELGVYSSTSTVIITIFKRGESATIFVLEQLLNSRAFHEKEQGSSHLKRKCWSSTYTKCHKYFYTIQTMVC